MYNLRFYGVWRRFRKILASFSFSVFLSIYYRCVVAISPKVLHRFEVRVCEEILAKRSLRSWGYFGRECFCFGREPVNASGEAVIVRGLLNSLVGFARERIWRLRRLPAHESRQLRRLRLGQIIDCCKMFRFRRGNYIPGSQ